MKKYDCILSNLAIGAVLLTGSLCVAQTTTIPVTTSPANAAARQNPGAKGQHGHSIGMAVDHAGGNGVRRMAGSNTSGTRTGAKSAGVNPLYEAKDKVAPKPDSGSSNHTSKDMTTRYRPGNNKTTRSANKTETQSRSSSPHN